MYALSIKIWTNTHAPYNRNKMPSRNEWLSESWPHFVGALLLFCLVHPSAAQWGHAKSMGF